MSHCPSSGAGGRMRPRARVSFAELSGSDAEGQQEGEEGGWEAAAFDAAAAPADDDELIVVAGGRGGAGKKRARTSAGAGGSGAPRARKASRGAASADPADAPSASPLINSLSERYTHPELFGAGSAALQGGSSLVRREASLHLGYFEQIGMPAKRSHSTLAGITPMSEETERAIVASLPPRHAPALARLRAHLYRSMRQWFLWQSAPSGGFNLLLYGLGSKKELLNHYARTWLTDAPVIVSLGYAPGTNVKAILNTLTRDLMHQPTLTFRDLASHLEYVREWFRKDAAQAATGGAGGGRRSRGHVATRVAEQQEEEEYYSEDEELQDEASTVAAAVIAAAGGVVPSSRSHASGFASSSSALLPRVYLLVHNIDGVSLRSESQQSILAALASIPQIRMLCSVDHIRSAWGWGGAQLAAFNFVGVDATNYSGYAAEQEAMAPSVSAAADGASGGAGEGGLVSSQLHGRAAGIGNVLASLTPTHRMVLDKLAHAQLDPGNADTKHMILPSSMPSSSASAGGGKGGASGRASASASGPLLLQTAFEDACMDSMLVSSSDNFVRLLGELRDHGLVAVRTVERTKVLCIPYAPLVIRRYVLGEEGLSDEAVAAAVNAQASAEAARATQRAERSRDAFARAAGGADDDEDADVGEGGGLEDEVEAAELDAAEEAEEESEEE